MEECLPTKVLNILFIIDIYVDMKRFKEINRIFSTDIRTYALNEIINNV